MGRAADGVKCGTEIAMNYCSGGSNLDAVNGIAGFDRDYSI
jgi:hypothetical protein